jgi:endonuclease/exonuclease/phosphatase family metal-dependent hydrolase
MMNQLRRLTRTPLIGVFFFWGIFASVSCEKKTRSANESDLSSSLQSVDEALSATDGLNQKKPTTSSATQATPVTSAVEATSDSPSTTPTLRFTAYNVANWLILEDRFDYDTKKSSKNAPKPADEKNAVIDILLSTKPDVIGLCEIGTREDLAEIQQLLKAKGLDLPASHFSGGIDQTRHLGLLSKFPIISTAQASKLDYVIAGKSNSMQRGILDATVKTPDERVWRFLGVHLKSKREVDGGDQNLMRINEAQLLRRHIEGILKEDAQARLICYGDFNDTRRTSPLRIVQGSYNSPTYIAPIALRDSRGELWTHYWEREDVYARIDYIHYSPALKAEVIYQECGIVDLPNWRKGSDHRAIKASFR